MKKRMACVALLMGIILPGSAQTFREQYEAFKQQAQQEYSDFRKKANEEYADFMRQAWENYQQLPEIPKPKEEPIPPRPYEEDGAPIEDTPRPIEEVIPTPVPQPQPIPLEPIREVPEPEENYFSFGFFGTECRVRLGERHRFALRGCSTNQVADGWERLSGDNYNNVIRDCLELRIRHRLCDWGYLLMLQELAYGFMGENSNEATLLCAYLYCQSGYRMRLGQRNGRLYMLVASRHQIYDAGYWVIDGEFYYPLNCEEKSLEICNVAFPNEQSLSLLVSETPLLAERWTVPRQLQSERYPEMKVEVSSNEVLQAFYATYPTSMLGDNFCSRWAMYANTPLSERVKQQLYPLLQNSIQGQTEREAVNRLLNFVQTAFVYEYDDKVWGSDRAFFAEETLYYPYCDCEDRSILFSRLVRDLLGLKVLLVYYPGHLATAVCFTEPVAGDYIQLDNRKFVVCDPTYIGAPVGATMPDMDNGKATVVLLTTY